MIKINFSLNVDDLDFTKGNGLIPVIIQDDKTSIVYMLGFMNKTALNKTLISGFVHFWSRSRDKLWMKGEQSGNKLFVNKILVDCDRDSLLIKVKLIGKYVCHTGDLTCFHDKDKTP